MVTFFVSQKFAVLKAAFQEYKNGSHPPMHHTPLDSAPRREAPDTPTTHASHPRSQPEQTQLPHQFVHFFKTPFSNWISLNLQSYLRPGAVSYLSHNFLTGFLPICNRISDQGYLHPIFCNFFWIIILTGEIRFFSFIMYLLLSGWICFTPLAHPFLR